MPKEKTWIHLWGETYVPKKNLLVVIGIFIALSFSYIFLNYNVNSSVTSFVIMWVFVALFIIVARKNGMQH